MILTKDIKEYCIECKTAIKESIKVNFPELKKKPVLAVI